MNVKKLTAAMLIGVCVMSSSMAAMAADDTQYTEFSYTMENDPTYSVTIPASISLSEEGTPLDIAASDVANLGDARVAVTIEGTDYFRNQMVLSGQTSQASYSKTVRYQLVAADGTVIETTGQDTVSGMEIASFQENGTVTYLAKPVAQGAGINVEPGVSYTGSMTFGISLAQ